MSPDCVERFTAESTLGTGDVRLQAHARVPMPRPPLTASFCVCTGRMGMGELRDAFRQSEPNLWSDWLENNMRLWTLCRAH